MLEQQSLQYTCDSKYFDRMIRSFQDAHLFDNGWVSHDNVRIITQQEANEMNTEFTIYEPWSSMWRYNDSPLLRFGALNLYGNAWEFRRSEWCIVFEPELLDFFQEHPDLKKIFTYFLKLWDHDRFHNFTLWMEKKFKDETYTLLDVDFPPPLDNIWYEWLSLIYHFHFMQELIMENYDILEKRIITLESFFSSIDQLIEDETLEDTFGKEILSVILSFVLRCIHHSQLSKKIEWYILKYKIVYTHDTFFSWDKVHLNLLSDSLIKWHNHLIMDKKWLITQKNKEKKEWLIDSIRSLLGKLFT